MRKKAFLALMLTLTIISSSGCQTEIKPADPKDGKYATQTSMTSLEYALYKNKQITVYQPVEYQNGSCSKSQRRAVIK